MPLAVYRYFLHFACVCHTQGPTESLALGDARNSPHRGLDCSTLPWAQITADGKHFCAQQLQAPAFPGCSTASLLCYPSSPVQCWPGCGTSAVSLCHCRCARHRHRHHVPCEGKDPSPAFSGHVFSLPPFQLLAQQLLIQLSSQSVTSSLIPVQMFYKSASAEQ